ncbi:hypothetical protein C7T94_08510 [Pedobacter yulinensis]|uniref:VCBS repeat-containing protein n=1 Tax=Pedobacter yulinensis TaxID=2126353 RepID=A0A2T3HJU8_9SPHI|nr:hypothetical protein [Pedobacter yulinensis]PST82689.1 hypothetical protein C7T94_08510 [Pedobacter yulinensis]
MVRKAMLFFLVLVSVQIKGLAQAPTQAVAVPHNLKGFVPKGYSVLNVTRGDLNRDAYPDAILVLFKAGEERRSTESERPEKRPLLILAGKPNKSYRLVARSDNAVYCVNCGGQMGDPFTGISIRNGCFSVEHYGGSGWRWTRIITFKYAPAEKNWYLFKDGGESFHATSPEQVKTKVRTAKDFGKITFGKFNIYKED